MRNQLGAASSKASHFGQKINQEFVKNLKPPAGKWQCKNGQKFGRCTKNTQINIGNVSDLLVIGEIKIKTT